MQKKLSLWRCEVYGVPETDSDIRLFAIYSYRFQPPEKMYVRFKSIEAISALRMAVRGEYDDAADMDMDGGGTSVDALMIMQGEVYSKSFGHYRKIGGHSNAERYNSA